MNWKLALAFLRFNLAAFSMVVTCNENVQMDVDPRMTMLMIDPFSENERNDLMLDTTGIPASDSNRSIASLATPGIPVNDGVKLSTYGGIKLTTYLKNLLPA